LWSRRSGVRVPSLTLRKGPAKRAFSDFMARVARTGVHQLSINLLSAVRYEQMMQYALGLSYGVFT
jgi:hypothetical protein